MSCSNFYQSLMRKKPLEDKRETKLKKFLTTFDLTAMGVGATVGMGVYVLTGEVAKNVAGPAVIISFAIAAFCSMLAGFCYAEFGARVPKAGSAYLYTFVAIGEFVAFLIGWNLILEYAIGSASIAKGITGYINELSGNKLSSFWREILPLNISFLGQYVDLFAFAIVMIVSIGQAFGARESTIVNNTFAAFKITVIVYVIGCGLFKLDFNNWQIPKAEVAANAGEGGFFPYGFEGVAKGAAICFYGYIGFDVIAAAGEEVKNPRKSLPLSISLSLLIVFLAYFGVASVLTLMVPYFDVDENAPLTHVFAKYGWDVAIDIVSFGSVVGLFSCLMGAMFPLPRIMLAMSSDGLLFKVFSNVHPRFQTPSHGILIAGLMTGSLSAIFDVKQLVDMISIGTLTSYTIVAICVLILRFNTADDGSDTEDYRVGFVQKLFNTDGYTRPTKFTSNLVSILLTVYTILCILLSAIVTNLGREILNNNVGIIILFSLIVVASLATLIILSRQPMLAKLISFNVPLTPWFPALSILMNIYLLSQLGVFAWIRFTVWLLIGLVIYIFYGRRNSLIAKEAQIEATIENIFD